MSRTPLIARLALAVGATCLTAGCGDTAPPQPSSAAPPGRSTPAPRRIAPPPPPPDRSLADLVEAPSTPLAAAHPLPVVQPRPVDPQRVRAAGIRRVAAARLELFTDLPPSPAVDELPRLFDAAYPQWCEYFSVTPSGSEPWRMHGFLMQDRARFVQAGLIPPELPDFKHGYSLGADLWLYEQPGDYYRRHLLLHEGTHGFMNTVLGGCGPPWYMEATAELLATHSWNDGRLRLNYFPQGREEVPQLGRIKLVQDAVAAGRMFDLEDLTRFGPDAHSYNEPYAWCWAMAAFLDGHPRYRDRFRQLAADVRHSDFDQRTLNRFAADWHHLADEWRVFAANLEYGYDLARMAIDFAPGDALPAAGAGVQVAADRGWQSSRLRLEAGRQYRLRAAGRYKLGERPVAWWCEPGGVSIRYYQGRPLGILLAAVVPDSGPAAEPSLVAPAVIGLEATLSPATSGTLYLRINESPAELADNSGTLAVTIESP